MKTLLIIPAYNESENIAEVINEARSIHPQLDLLVVDDGSSDDTSEAVHRLGVKALRHPFNLGYGAAVQTGIIYAFEQGFDACVLIDADGQHDPKYISALIEPVAKGEADLALGSRFLGHAAYSIGVARKLAMSFFSRLASLITRRKITDPTSGFQAINRNLMRFFASDNYPADFPDADILIRLHFAGFRIKEVPVTIRPRLRGQSMHGGASFFYYVYKMLFSILVALTESKSFAKGGNHAAGNEDTGFAHEPADTADDSGTCAQKTAR